MHLDQKYRYRRRLPHIQSTTVIVDFVTDRRWILPPLARDIIFDCCLYEDKKTIELIAAVVMSDHVHLLFGALRNQEGWPHSLPRIIGSIKSAAAHKANKALGRKGPFWQEEFWDHALRHGEPLEGAIGYICNNPVKAGLVTKPEDYKWLYVAPGY